MFGSLKHPVGALYTVVVYPSECGLPMFVVYMYCTPVLLSGSKGSTVFCCNIESQTCNCVSIIQATIAQPMMSFSTCTQVIQSCCMRN